MQLFNTIFLVITVLNVSWCVHAHTTKIFPSSEMDMATTQWQDGVSTES
ncbi:hypothetical protein L917_01474 [Phytophthora nicotianae]|uniref:RxLR effector protein n=1 Tax=Phytophthora nicotianae TaxID=4792 RepID=W2LX40_PHYNI|nr:hypothetical protein L915_01519 [Phytophthora nicotianae]ETL48957.1 hypothetical protein L916_01493 [Phytophthora nicotianae]ETM01997.1 hypothetical protein L917_01474 [Phytophthora nicotianae]